MFKFVLDLNEGNAESGAAEVVSAGSSGQAVPENISCHCKYKK